MKIIQLLVLLFSASTLAAQPLRTGKDYAVFFVASKFDNGWKSLPDAPSEVNLLAADLRDDYGFEVRVMADAKRTDILRTLGEYKGKKYGPDDQLLLFFSMHGYHDAGSDKGYLIPKDGLYNDPIYETWLAHSQLAEITASIPCRRVLVSLDACYSGIFSGSRDKPGAAPWETGDDCQARVKAAFAGRDQTRKYVAAGGDQRVPAKSDFAAQWHRAFQQGYGEDGLLSFAELTATLDQFRDPRPVWGDFVHSTFGDFVFVRKNGCNTVPILTGGGGAADQDKAQWRQTQSSNTLASYRQYLRDCNLCLYTEEAEAAIARLKMTTPALPNETKKTVDMPDNMVFVKGGTFTMGCKDGRDSECSDNEKPAHSVTLSDFYIGKYEVTQAEWTKVMGSNPSSFKNCDNCPVEHVSWNDVQEFFKKLNAQNPSKTYRLPTEAQWEYAARGGNQSKRYAYSGSNTLSDVGWYDGNSNSKTHPVGGLRANELGIFDMSGNVREWCADDWHESYSSAPRDGQSWVENPRGQHRVSRGGSWYPAAVACRPPVRYHWIPSDRNTDLGFRLALSLY